MSLVAPLADRVDDEDFKKAWWDIKLQNKRRLIKWVYKNTGVKLNENSLFDVMIKRIHEYKRQLMNALYIVLRYLQLKDMTPEQRAKTVPRSTLIGGKAAPGYLNAKRIIKLIGAIQNTINADPDTKDYLQVVFLPNYNVSAAEVIIPAAEVSQHISTAGTEASGTSNMKFCFNGCLIIGTMDGANVEIAHEAGEENMFIFGALVGDIEKLREKMRKSEPEDYHGKNLQRVFNFIEEGNLGHQSELSGLINCIRNRNDHYLVCADFESYCKAQERIDETYKNRDEWIRKSIKTAVLTSKFSSDRTIDEYASDIWKITPVEIPKPAMNALQRVKSFTLDNGKDEKSTTKDFKDSGAKEVKDPKKK